MTVAFVLPIMNAHMAQNIEKDNDIRVPQRNQWKSVVHHRDIMTGKFLRMGVQRHDGTDIR